jgi:hypothetical protein
MSRSADASSQGPIWRLQRRPYRYALALVLACSSIIALILLSSDHSISVKDKFTQVGAGLAASIIFAVIYTILANREYAELIRTEIDGQLAGHLNDILHHVKQLNQLFLPTDQYPATKDFDPRFNRDLNHDMAGSKFYFFRGTSAKYVPARLRFCEHHLEVAQVVLLDPNDAGVIEARAVDRRRRPEHAGSDLTQVKLGIRHEILLALIALFDCRDQCAIEIGFSAAASPVRIEIFDNAIYTSLYRSAESERNTHPETARFDRESQMYQIFRDECRRQMELATSRRRFVTGESDQNLCDFLSTLGFDGIGPADLTAVRTEYRAFIAPFAKALKTTGVAA